MGFERPRWWLLDLGMVSWTISILELEPRTRYNIIIIIIVGLHLWCTYYKKDIGALQSQRWVKSMNKRLTNVKCWTEKVSFKMFPKDCRVWFSANVILWQITVSSYYYFMRIVCAGLFVNEPLVSGTVFRSTPRQHRHWPSFAVASRLISSGAAFHDFTVLLSCPRSDMSLRTR